MDEIVSTPNEPGEDQKKPPKKPRKPRVDKGTIQATNRDLIVLRWIAEQYAIRWDQAAELLSAYNDEGDRVERDLLSESRIRQIIDKRWIAAGWAAKDYFLYGELPYVWITAKGLRLLGLEEYYSKAAPPAATRLSHIFAVNEARMKMKDLGHDWQSERSYLAELGPKKKGAKLGPIPDGCVIFDEGLVAVEVELSTKKPDDLEKKLRRAARNFLSVWVYVHTDETRNAVTKARAKLEEHYQRKVFIYDLDI
jgi:hypothetical protein